MSAGEVELIYEFRGKDLDNINSNSALDLHLLERGIDKKDVVSVKHWQNMKGELRFSIVTKEDIGKKITIEDYNKECKKGRNEVYRYLEWLNH